MEGKRVKTDPHPVGDSETTAGNFYIVANCSRLVARRVVVDGYFLIKSFTVLGPATSTLTGQSPSYSKIQVQIHEITSWRYQRRVTR